MFYFNGVLNTLKRCRNHSKTWGQEGGVRKAGRRQEGVCPQHASGGSLATGAGELDTSAPEPPGEPVQVTLTAKQTVMSPGIF